MYPHERSLVKRLEGQPFVLIGVNSDRDRDELRSMMVKEQITWRSFLDGSDGPIARDWKVSAWPTLVLIDHRGVIRMRRGGTPGAAALDRMIDELLAAVGKAGAPIAP